MSDNEFEKVRKYWPNRKIFQGAVRAYARYSEIAQLPWVYMERPIWEHVFSFFNFHSKILDVGAGSGKLTELALATNFHKNNIVAHKPNTILRQMLQKKIPIVQTMRGSLDHLSDRLEKYGGRRHLISANMVFNHLDRKSLELTLNEIFEALLPLGYLAFVIPNPEENSHKHARDNDQEWVKEEPVPWGGFAEYYHRSTSLYLAILLASGFTDAKAKEYGYEDSLHGFQIEPYEMHGKNMRGPKRTLIVARKHKKVVSRVMNLPTIRPSSVIYENGRSVYLTG